MNGFNTIQISSKRFDEDSDHTATAVVQSTGPTINETAETVGSAAKFATGFGSSFQVVGFGLNFLI